MGTFSLLFGSHKHVLEPDEELSLKDFLGDFFPSIINNYEFLIIINGNRVHKDKLDTYLVQDGDIITITPPVAGGSK